MKKIYALTIISTSNCILRTWFKLLCVRINPFGQSCALSTPNNKLDNFYGIYNGNSIFKKDDLRFWNDAISNNAKKVKKMMMKNK